MPTESAYRLARRIEADVARLLAASSGLELEPALRKMVPELKHALADARLDVRDYELAETRTEQSHVGQTARERLETARQGILAVSQENLIGATDVAELTARIDYLLERIT